MYIITDHNLTPSHRAAFSYPLVSVQSPNFSSRPANSISLVVIHYTAGASAASTASYCATKAAAVSYHLIIDRTGSIYQCVPFNRVAWHAGLSEWGGKNNVNSFSIGIGLANWGPVRPGFWPQFYAYPNNYTLLLPTGTTVYRANHKGDNTQPPSANRFWEAYPLAQILSLRAVLSALLPYYQIAEIIGHDDCAPGRKTDPGPAFPSLPVLATTAPQSILLSKSIHLPPPPSNCAPRPFYHCVQCNLPFRPEDLSSYPEPSHNSLSNLLPSPQQCPLCGTQLSFFC